MENGARSSKSDVHCLLICLAHFFRNAGFYPVDASGNRLTADTLVKDIPNIETTMLVKYVNDSGDSSGLSKR